MILRDWRDSWQRFGRRLNPPVLRCKACGSVLHRYTHGWARAVHVAVWIAIYYVVVAPWDLSSGATILFGLVLGLPYTVATSRLYHAWWMRHHPVRCGGGGHLAPVKDKL